MGVLLGEVGAVIDSCRSVPHMEESATGAVSVDLDMEGFAAAGVDCSVSEGKYLIHASYHKQHGCDGSPYAVHDVKLIICHADKPFSLVFKMQFISYSHVQVRGMQGTDG